MTNFNQAQDRGTKKWTTMMLPEHKEQLKDMWKQEYHHKRPDFDEQQLEEFSATIIHAYKEKHLVHITYCSEKIYSEQNVREITGVITSVNSRLQTIDIKHTCIYLKTLLDIQLA